MLHDRIERLETMLKTEINAIINLELSDPKIPDFIIVYRVKLAKDLSTALVQLSFQQELTPQAIKEAIQELNHAAGFVGHLCADRIALKRHPKLHFVYNETVKHILELEKVFEQIKHEHPE